MSSEEFHRSFHYSSIRTDVCRVLQLGDSLSLYIFSSVFLCGCDPKIRVFWHQKTWVQVLHPSLPSLVHPTPLLVMTSTWFIFGGLLQWNKKNPFVTILGYVNSSAGGNILGILVYHTKASKQQKLWISHLTSLSPDFFICERIMVIPVLPNYKGY